jgi:hypothetical protein
MGKRGPKPGFMRERAAAKAAAAVPNPNDAQQQPAATAETDPHLAPPQGPPDMNGAPDPKNPPPETAPPLTHADLHNPAKLTGDALKDYAYRLGIARSQMEGQSDERIRMSIRYIVSHRAETDS